MLSHRGGRALAPRRPCALAPRWLCSCAEAVVLSRRGGRALAPRRSCSRAEAVVLSHRGGRALAPRRLCSCAEAVRGRALAPRRSAVVLSHRADEACRQGQGQHLKPAEGLLRAGVRKRETEVYHPQTSFTTPMYVVGTCLLLIRALDERSERDVR